MISFDLGVRIAFGEGIIKEAAFKQDLLRMDRMSTENRGKIVFLTEEMV